MTSEFARTAGFASRQGTNHRTPGAVCKGVKGEVEIRTVMHSHMAMHCREGNAQRESRTINLN